MKILASILLLVIIAITAGCTDVKPNILSDKVFSNNFSTITLASWNLQIFGQSKASNQTLMEFYANKIKNYDIVFIQEIRDSSQTAFPQLCSMLPDYTCVASSRAGRTSSKEQYGLIYKQDINLIDFFDFNPDQLDRWERPPVLAVFNLSNSTNSPLVVINIHIKPDDVKKELENLASSIVQYPSTDLGALILLGDLNADCSYYNTDKEPEFDSWNWLIKDSEDTASTASDCAYDRIISTKTFEVGIDKEGITPAISDHYLVWAKIEV
jgi:endonuclease/exonuclease/phosphatase family metal-dependent hydrolase